MGDEISKDVAVVFELSDRCIPYVPTTWGALPN